MIYYFMKRYQVIYVKSLADWKNTNVITFLYIYIFNIFFLYVFKFKFKLRFRYRDGRIPTHTKSTFYFVKYALMFMHKARNFPSSLPISLRKTIPTNTPSTADCNHEAAPKGSKIIKLGVHIPGGHYFP